jgi:hypothetical protein
MLSAYRDLARYHIGRHVANLQVANTYEGMCEILHPRSSADV